MIVPFLKAAITPSTTPPVIHMMSAVMASDSETGSASAISSLTVLELYFE